MIPVHAMTDNEPGFDLGPERPTTPPEPPVDLRPRLAEAVNEDMGETYWWLKKLENPDGEIAVLARLILTAVASGETQHIETYLREIREIEIERRGREA